MQKKAIIIGSGVAGLASAIRLSLSGFEVTLFEKNNYPGGKLTGFKKGGYFFDAGPSLFTQPENIKELFELANEPMSNYLEYDAQAISCKYFYEDGSIINAYTNQQDFANEIQTKLGEDASKVISYLKQSEKTYNNIGVIFLNYSLHKIATLFSAPILKALKSVKPGFLFGTLHQLNAKHFTNKKTIQLFDRYATFNGSNPYKAPGMLSLIPHLDNNIGTFYPKGGMISITRALYKLAVKLGVKFHFNRLVDNIVTENNKVKGVSVQQEIFYADVVISNMDVYFTYKQLLKDHKKAKQILKQERSSSALIFYWGIKKSFPPLELHNIFFATDYEKEFDSLFNTKTIYNDPTVYVNITAKCEPGLHCPEGKENWFVMINTPANTGQNWEVYQQQYKKLIITKLNRLLQTDIESLIEVEEVLSPLTIESKTKSYMGSIYGTSSNGKLAAFYRHPNFSKKFKGLYFVGGSVHPGGGIPLCLQSAKIASKIIEEDFSIKN